MQLQLIQQRIHDIRGQKVILDYDLSELYEVETRVLKQAVRRNIHRFPKDFMFEITRDEYHFLRSQIVTLENGRGKHSKYLPFAFTEQGVAMLASVLSSAKAIAMNIQIVRVFVHMRQHLFSHEELSKKVKELEATYDRQFDDIYEVINYLLNKDNIQQQQNERKQIGFRNYDNFF